MASGLVIVCVQAASSVRAARLAADEPPSAAVAFTARQAGAAWAAGPATSPTDSLCTLANSHVYMLPQTPSAGSSPQRQRRQLDPRARQSEFKGLLSSFTGEDDDGLLDVRFERRGKGGSSGSKEAGRKRR